MKQSQTSVKHITIDHDILAPVKLKKNWGNCKVSLRCRGVQLILSQKIHLVNMNHYQDYYTSPALLPSKL